MTVELKLPSKHGDSRKVAVIGDIHNPYQDQTALALVEDFLITMQPDVLVYNGDVNDFYQLSKFDKDPSRMDRLQADLNNTKKMFKHHAEILPKARKILIKGNHEDRWERFLRTSAPVLECLDCLELDRLFGLKTFGIKTVEYEEGLMINGVFLILHSDIVSIHSAYTAKRLYEKHGGCGMCNHTHRGGSFYKRDRFGTWGWWENFCLCRLDPDWIMNPNWQHGFSLIHFRDERFWVEQIPIIKDKFMYAGEIFELYG